MKKQNIYISIVIIIAAVALGIYLMRRHVQAPVTPMDQAATSADMTTGDRTFSLACDAGKTMSVTFHLPEDKNLSVALGDGRTMTLMNSSSQAGSSYTSADGSVVLALDGTVLKLTEGKSVTYTNCSLTSGPATK